MGAESSILNELDFDDDPQIPSGTICLPRHARLKDGTRVSVFLFEKGSKEFDLRDNAAKQLKLLRHPYILRFLNWCHCPEGRVLITDYAQPLETVLQQLSPAEVCAGLYSIIEALVFLHETGGLCHNNVCLSSVYVAEDGTWKLGGMEFLCHQEQATITFLENCRAQRDQKAIAPEEKGGSLLIDPASSRMRDVYAFGVLAESLMEMLVDLGDMTKTFELRIQDECLHPDPQHRPQLSSLLQDRLFQNDYVNILYFLRNITLKDEESKVSFFGSVVKKLYELPETVVAKRLLQPLMSRFVLLEQSAAENLHPHLLTPYKGLRPEYCEGHVNPVLSEDVFRTYMIPQLFKIFHVRDAPIRLLLLDNFSAYVHLFDTRTLRSVILPQVLLGVRDSNDELVAGSLHALATIVPLLGGDTVIGSHRIKLFSEGTPRFKVSNKDSAFQPARPAHLATANGKPSVRKSNGQKKTLKELASECNQEPGAVDGWMASEDVAIETERTSFPKEHNQSTVDISCSAIDIPCTAASDTDAGELPGKQHGSAGPHTPISHSDKQTHSHYGSEHHKPGSSQHNAQPNKGALKLKAPKSKCSPPPAEHSEQGWGPAGEPARRSPADGEDRHQPSSTSDTDWAAGWKDDFQTSDADNREHSSSSQTSHNNSPNKTVSPARQLPDTLGAEFDIMSINVKKKPDPDKDLFDMLAGMEPSIRKPTNLLASLTDVAAPPGQTSTSLSYMLQDTEDLDSSGWGVDDWGEIEDIR